MILFLNVFITDNGIGKYFRGLLPQYTPVDIFKYSLASLSVIDWNHVIIYYTLDTNYKHRREEIDQYIKSLFHAPIIYSFRNEHQSQWKVAINELIALEDNWVWFCCNHDHIFIDYELDLLKRIEAKLIDLSKSYEYVSCYFTHWTEILYHSKTPPRFTKVGSIEENKDYFVTIWHNYDSAQIVNKNILRYWWFEHDYGDTWMPRTDNGGLHSIDVRSPKIACVIPYRELVRHFDGYTTSADPIPCINICPPLFIPEGFFDNDVKILYCSDIRKKGYVDINPLKEYYTIIDHEGTDMKCVLEDIPLFWRSRISQIEIAKDIDRKLLLKYRNDEILKMGCYRFQIEVMNLLKHRNEEIQLEAPKDVDSTNDEILRMICHRFQIQIADLLLKYRNDEILKIIQTSAEKLDVAIRTV